MKLKVILKKINKVLPEGCIIYLNRIIKDNPNITLKEIIITIPEDIGYYLFKGLKLKNVVPDYISRKIMINKIQSSEIAYYWALNIGDREIMRDRIQMSVFAYYWAKNIGDKEIMREKIKSKEFIKLWIETFPEDKKYFKKEG